MIRVQYARRHHVKIGFKGLKDESFSMNANNLNDNSEIDLNNFNDKSYEDQSKNDITST